MIYITSSVPSVTVCISIHGFVALVYYTIRKVPSTLKNFMWLYTWNKWSEAKVRQKQRGDCFPSLPQNCDKVLRKLTDLLSPRLCAVFYVALSSLHVSVWLDESGNSFVEEHSWMSLKEMNAIKVDGSNPVSTSIGKKD